MTTVVQLRAAILAKVQGVSGMGRVHDYQRFHKDASKLADLYYTSAQAGRRLYGWHIRRVGTTELLVDTGRNFRDVRWALRGFMSLDDAGETEKLFDDQVEAICDAFRADSRLGGICETQFREANGNQAGIQVDELEPVMFCGVLCHGAKLGLVTRLYTNTP